MFLKGPSSSDFVKTTPQNTKCFCTKISSLLESRGFFVCLFVLSNLKCLVYFVIPLKLFVPSFIHSLIHSVFVSLLCARHSSALGSKVAKAACCFKWAPAWPSVPLSLVYHIIDALKLSIFQQTNNGKFFH